MMSDMTLWTAELVVRIGIEFLIGDFWVWFGPGLDYIPALMSNI